MPPTRMNTDLTPELLAHMQAIKAKATEYGLDFFEVVYEVLDFDTMNQIAATRAGTVTRILVEDAQPVEYGEPLLIIE